MRIDALDAAILLALQEDARSSFRELAQSLGTTTPTIAARVRALEDIQLIRGYHASIEGHAIGARSYVVMVEARPADAADVATHVAGLAGAQTVQLLAGGRVFATVRLQPPMGLSDLHAAVSATPGLLRYEAWEAMRTHVGPAMNIVTSDLDVPCHQCHGPIHGDPVRARLGGRLHVFCCKGCAATFRSRFDARQSG